MLMYNLIEYCYIYLKTSGILWKYYRDEPALDNADTIIDFHPNNNKSVGDDGTKDTKVMVAQK